jgi:hypothetical protein
MDLLKQKASKPGLDPDTDIEHTFEAEGLDLGSKSLYCLSNSSGSFFSPHLDTPCKPLFDVQ